MYVEKEVVWLGDILWIGSMAFSHNRYFIAPNIIAADCYLHHWYDYKECVHVVEYKCVTVCDE